MITQNPFLGRASGSIDSTSFKTVYGKNIVTSKSTNQKSKLNIHVKSNMHLFDECGTIAKNILTLEKQGRYRNLIYNNFMGEQTKLLRSGPTSTYLNIAHLNVNSLIIRKFNVKKPTLASQSSHQYTPQILTYRIPKNVFNQNMQGTLFGLLIQRTSNITLIIYTLYCHFNTSGTQPSLSFDRAKFDPNINAYVYSWYHALDSAQNQYWSSDQLLNTIAPQ